MATSTKGIAGGGELSVLNCMTGDIKVQFDKDDVLETERAKRIITDMLARGYVLFVDEGDGKLKKVRSFNAKRECYIIADLGSSDASDEAGEAPKKKTRKREVPLKKTRATGIAPTAGG